jgi:flagellar hook-associated protein FlgK
MSPTKEELISENEELTDQLEGIYDRLASAKDLTKDEILDQIEAIQDEIENSLELEDGD